MSVTIAISFTAVFPIPGIHFRFWPTPISVEPIRPARNSAPLAKIDETKDGPGTCTGAIFIHVGDEVEVPVFG